MSQYTQFFVRSRNDEFLPIGSYSGSTYMARALEHITPYEKIKALDITSMQEVRNKLIGEFLEGAKTDLEMIKEKLAHIDVMTGGSFEEKFDAWTQYKEAEKETEREIKEIETTIAEFNFIVGIVADARFDETIDDDNYVYVGVEIDKATVEDIVKS